jgi:hypothetical protein
MEVKQYKANEKTFVLYTVSRYNIKTKEFKEFFAFGMEPLIHVLGKR